MSWSNNQKQAAEFMRKAGQVVRDRPEVPPPDECVRCAKLIHEECMELISALGVDLHLNHTDNANGVVDWSIPLSTSDISYTATRKPDMVEVADGIADSHFVVSGCACACGMNEQEFIEEVQRHNMEKFGPGGYRREDGKWQKPANIQPPRIKEILDGQGFDG